MSNNTAGPSASGATAAGTRIGQAPRRKSVGERASEVDLRRLPWRTVFASLGFLASIYLTIQHFTLSAPLGCPEGSLINCTAVLTSPQSSFIGIPVPIFGLVYFAVALVLIGMRRRAPSSAGLEGFAHLWATGGAVVVLALLYTELFVVGKICLWCSFTHLMALALFVLELWPVYIEPWTGATRQQIRAHARAQASRQGPNQA